MSRGPGVLEAAALVDRDVDEDRAGFHLSDGLVGDQFGRLRARDQHGTDHQVGLFDGLLQFQPRGVAGLDGSAVFGVDLAQNVDVQVENGDVGAHAPGDGGGVVAGHPAADHHHPGRRHPGHAAHQHAAATAGAHQVVGADLSGEPTGDFTHRRQQRQRNPVVRADGLHRLVGDGCDARFQQRVGARLGGREMQIGEQHLPAAHPGVLRFDGFLDLQQQVGFGPHLIGGPDDPRAGGREVRVVDGRTLAGSRLDEHLVAVAHQFAGAGGGDRNAVLVVLDLGGYADAHGYSSLCGCQSRSPNCGETPTIRQYRRCVPATRPGKSSARPIESVFEDRPSLPTPGGSSRMGMNRRRWLRFTACEWESWARGGRSAPPCVPLFAMPRTSCSPPRSMPVTR